MKTLIIIPAYNEAKNIPWVLENLVRECPQFDYIIINDGSNDDTRQLCSDNQYHCLNLPINTGLANAVGTGMKYAYEKGYDIAIQFDADGQHLPEYLPLMVAEIESGHDIVIGSRFVTEKKPLSLRMLGNSLIGGAVFITTGKRLTDTTSGLRAYSKRVIKEFATQMNYTPEPDTICYLLRRGLKVSEVQVAMKERIAGKSYLNTMNAIKYMVRMGISILLMQWVRRGSLGYAETADKRREEA